MVCRLRGNYAELSEGGGSVPRIIMGCLVTPLVSLCVCEDVRFWSVTLGIGAKSGRRIPNICTIGERFVVVVVIGLYVQRLT